MKSCPEFEERANDDLDDMLEPEAIGKLLGLSPGTSRAQLHRARRLLKEALES